MLQRLREGGKVIYHKHLLVNAKVRNPINTEQEGIDFLTNLVNKIDMKIIKGPFASYVDKEGNKGLTAIVMIETSHIAFHIWDEVDPALVQFDLYTCGQLELDKVLAIFKETFERARIQARSFRDRRKVSVRQFYRNT
jgi:S-adenosylmethionine/arginine decarboxylase-like enzyme